MIEFSDMLTSLAATKSISDKEVIIGNFAAGDDNVRKLLVETFSTDRVFNIKAIDDPAFSADQPNPHYQPVFCLLDALAAGTHKGNSAKAFIGSVLKEYTRDQQAAIKRVIQKDLKVGVGVPLINKVMPGLIQTFPIALAAKLKDINMVKLPVLADIKYDGYRQIAKVTAGKVTYWSREGREGDKYKGVFNAELLTLRDRIGHDIAVDGEALGKDFASTQMARAADGDDHHGALRFYVFSVMPLAEFEDQIPGLSDQEMKAYKERLLSPALGFERLIPSEGRVCGNLAELMEMYQYAIAKKYEGLLLKDLSEPYSYKRSGNWIKWKPKMEDLDAQVLGVFEGEKGSALENNCGGLIVRGTTEEQVVFECRMGSGIPLDIRAQIWADHTGQPCSYTTFKDNVPTVHMVVPSALGPVVGRWLTMEAQEVTKARDKEMPSVRFPVFRRWRDAK